MKLITFPDEDQISYIHNSDKVVTGFNLISQKVPELTVGLILDVEIVEFVYNCQVYNIEKIGKNRFRYNLKWLIGKRNE